MLNSTGTFTASEAGVYQLAFMAVVYTSTSSSVHCYLYVNDKARVKRNRGQLYRVIILLVLSWVKFWSEIEVNSVPQLRLAVQTIANNPPWSASLITSVAFPPHRSSQLGGSGFQGFGNRFLPIPVPTQEPVLPVLTVLGGSKKISYMVMWVSSILPSSNQMDH